MSTLAAIVLVCAIAICLIILAFLKPLRVLYMRVVAAEAWKAAALGETIVGIKTVKSLGLEPQRKALWDERVAEVRQMATRIRALGQLAADFGQSDRAHDGARHRVDWRLHGHERSKRLHGRRRCSRS